MRRVPPELLDILRETGRTAADSGVTAIVEAAERGAEKRREEACLRVVMLRRRLARLRSKPNRWRLVARAVTKRQLSRAEDWCTALMEAGKR